MNYKSFFSFLMACMMVGSLAGQYSISVEEHAVDGVPGTITYRFYVNMENPGDFLGSILGNDDFPTEIHTANGFYNDAGATGSSAAGINPVLLLPPVNAVFPGLPYDSWFTIGIETAPQGDETAITAVEGPNGPWVGCFDASSELSGQDVLINDAIGGAWFVPSDSPNGVPDAVNQRVLFAQITSDSAPFGQVTFFVLANGPGGEEDIYFTIAFNGAGTFYEDGTSSTPGCTDSSALNYEPDATSDDGSCEYELSIGTNAESFYVCDFEGTAITEFETWLSTHGGATAVGGCSDFTWTNDYDPSASYNCMGENPEVVVFTATDDCGNSVSDTVMVVLGDAGAPIIDVWPNDMMVTCDGNELNVLEDWLASAGGAQAHDVCGSLTWANDYFGLIDDGSGVSSATVTFSAYDNCGNISTAIAQFQVECIPAGCTDFDACNFDYDALEDDGSCLYPQANCEVCDGNGGTAIQDSDSDGVCDFDEVAGCMDEMACNYNESATDDDGSCLYAQANCEVCDGNGGTVIQDADSDGVCDFDEVAGCMDNTACNYDATATDSGACIYADGPCEICNSQGGVDIIDPDGDGVCNDGGEISGCQDVAACNYDPEATDSDGSCEYVSCVGCMDSAACNYDPDATVNVNSLCYYPPMGFTCDGNPSDAGCMDSTACNYNATAISDDGSCEYCSCTNQPMAPGYSMTIEEHAVDGVEGMTTYRFYIDMENPDDFLSSVYGNSEVDLVISTNGAGFFNDPAATGGSAAGVSPNFFLPPYDAIFPELPFDSWFTIGIEHAPQGNESAVNAAEIEEEPWVNTFVAGSDTDGQDVSTGEGAWFVLNGVPNGLPDATNQRTLFMQLTTSGTISGSLSVQVFVNGVGADDIRMSYVFEGPGTYGALQPETVSFDCGCTDEMAVNFDAQALYDDGSCIAAVPGCMDDTACNYDVDANQDNGMCEFAVNGYDCDGVCLADADGDGICDEFEVAGCTDCTACNFSSDATDEDGTCAFASPGYDCQDNCIIDSDGDGVCDAFEIVGCQDNTACNYDASATNSGFCLFADTGYDCQGNCLADADSDGVCDPFEIDGCTDGMACNFNPSATDDDGSCQFATPGYDCQDNCIIDSDGDGICDAFEIVGCTSNLACNYDANATETGYCVFPQSGYNCDGNCLNDADGDGVCDDFEVGGCTDGMACNFNADATDEDGTCSYSEAGYDCSGNCEIDTDGDGVCDAFEVVGCLDSLACNYDASATDSGYCVFTQDEYDCDGNCLSDSDGDGVCDAFEVSGCDDPNAINFQPLVTDEDPGSCLYPDDFVSTCYDFNDDGYVGITDLLDFLQQIGTYCN